MAAPQRTPPSRGLAPRHLAVLAGALAAGLALVALVFFRPGWDGGPTLTPRFPLAGFLARLPGRLQWLWPFVAVAACLPGLRALVWRELLPEPAPRLSDAYHATALGALVHNVVPGKLGPLAAAWALARMSGRAFTPALSSQLVAKLLELGAIVALGAVAAGVRVGAPALGKVVLAGAALFALLASIAGVLALAAPRAARRVAGRFPRVGAALTAIADGILGAGRPVRLAAALALAVLPAAGAAAAYALPLRAAGVPESVAGGALLVAVIAFGQLTPGLPVGAGVYWSLASWAARQLGAAPEDAAALAILTHLGMVGTGLLVGLASAIVRRATVAELVRRRREVEHLADPRPRGPT